MAAYQGTTAARNTATAASRWAGRTRGHAPVRRHSRSAIGSSTAATSAGPTGPFTSAAPAAAESGCGEPRQARGRRRRTVRTVEQADQRCPHRGRDEERQRQVRQRLVRHRDPGGARRRNDAGEQRLRLAAPPARAEERDQHEAQAGQRGGEPRGARRRPRGEVRAGRRPVVQHRLLEARLVVVVGGQPVTALDHLARALGVEAFVGIGDGRPSERGEEGQGADPGEQQEVTRHVGSHSTPILSTWRPWRWWAPLAIGASSATRPCADSAMRDTAWAADQPVRRRHRGLAVVSVAARRAVRHRHGPRFYVPPEIGVQLVRRGGRPGDPDAVAQSGRRRSGRRAARARARARAGHRLQHDRDR